MIRILGYNLEKNKQIYIALTNIYGVGVARAKTILKNLNITPTKKIYNLSDLEITNIRNMFENATFLIEGNLKRFVAQNIKRLIEINCYKGRRHLKKLPVRGQRTRTNSRSTRKIKN